ncbi:recombinase family protein [Spirillospora sp. NPDC052269]
MKHPRLIAYARISDLSGKRGTTKAEFGVQAQHSLIDRIVRRENGSIVRRYTDNDRSASRGAPRPGFDALLLDLYRGRTGDGLPVDGVVCTDEDRLFKTSAQLERLLCALRAHPGRLLVVEHGHVDLCSPEGYSSAAESVAVSVGENVRRKGRTRRWHRAQAERGAAHTGGRPFGYQAAPESAETILVVPEEAAIVRQAVAACIAGESWAEITRIFDHSGIPTRRGGPWRPQTVKQIVSSPRNAGLRLLDGELVCDDAGHPVLGTWQAIIDPADWEKVRTRYEPRRRLPGGRSANTEAATARRYVLSGLLRCGNPLTTGACGTILAASATSIGASRYRYACRPKGDGGCSGVGVSGEWIDARIGDLVLAAADHGVLASPDGLLWAHQVELDALLERRSELETQWRCGDMGDASFYRTAAAIADAIDVLRRERDDWSIRTAPSTDSAQERRRRWEAGSGPDGYSLAARRALIFGMLESVVVFPVGKGTKSRRDDSFRLIWKSP